MNRRVVGQVLAKELRETLRDRRTLMIMVVLPVFLYPALLVLVEQLTLFGHRKLAADPVAVVAVGGDPDLLAFLDGDPEIRLVQADTLPRAAVSAGAVHAAVVLPSGLDGGRESAEARIVYDGSRERSAYARGVIGDRLEAWGDSLLARRLAREGLPPTFVRPLVVAETSVATAEEMGGYALGRILPLLLIMMTVLGAFYPAIDLAAGEKERGTLETLLTAAVPADEIVTGKFIAVTVVAFAAAALNLGSMLLTFQTGLFQFAKAMDVSFSLPPMAVAVILGVLVPLAILFAALFLGIAVRSHSFREAQSMLTPVYILSFLPAILATLPGIEFTTEMALVPVAGVAFLVRELLSGGAPFVPSAVALAATVVYAALALVFAARSFGREDVLFGADSGTAPSGTLLERVRGWGGGARGLPTPGAAAAFVAGVALLYFYAGGALQAGLGERGLLASQWLLLFVPAVLFAALGPYDLRRTLALRPVGPRGLGAALLVVAGGIPLGWVLGWLQTFVFPVPEGLLEALGRLLTAGDARRMLWLLFLVAVTPAVCEELVFRGVLLQGLGRDASMWRAVGLTAVIFGAFHLSFETVIRFLPTAWMGFLVGFVVWHTRSVLAGMLMHFLNNGVGVLLVSTPAVRARLVTPDGEPWWPAVAAAPLLLAAGVWLLPRRSPAPTDAVEVASAPAT